MKQQQWHNIRTCHMPHHSSICDCVCVCWRWMCHCNHIVRVMFWRSQSNCVYYSFILYCVWTLTEHIYIVHKQTYTHTVTTSNYICCTYTIAITITHIFIYCLLCVPADIWFSISFFPSFMNEQYLLVSFSIHLVQMRLLWKIKQHKYFFLIFICFLYFIFISFLFSRFVFFFYLLAFFFRF